VTKPLIDLKPANSNPWYVLMTLHGEQLGVEIDKDLHEKNVKYWNRLRGPIPQTSYAQLIEKHGLTFRPRDDGGIQEDIKQAYQAQWIMRNPDLEMPSIPNANDKLNLSKTIFKNLFAINNMYFGHMLDFSGSKFEKDASFTECGFCKTVDLSKVEIMGKADFSHSYFLSDFVAKDMKVRGNLVAKKVAVDGDLDFCSVQVTGAAILNHMQIKGQTTVDNVSFESGCNFDDSKFRGVALFRGADFKGGIGFRSATFVNDADFYRVDFHGDANFASSIFEKEVNFQIAIFHKCADFRKVQFKGITDFSESKFNTHGTDHMAGIQFTDAIFSKSTSFRQCDFAHSYPEFTNSDIYPVTDFSADKALWPSGITSPEKEARESCGIIRNLLAQKGLAEDQHFFFRREMMFTSHHETFIRRIPYQAYKCLSDYGYSIALPLFWITFVWIVGFVSLSAYFAGNQYLCFEDISAHLPCWTLPPTLKPEWDGWTAAGLSFSNLFPLFGFGRVFFNEVLEALPPVLKFVSGLQTVISLPLFFLLGLGLRQRFRLR
jgi:uncharacterized protein YjbI with pentapeptide repeats